MVVYYGFFADFSERASKLGHGSRPPAQYAKLNQLWTAAPIVPSLYLHGRDDGCFTSAFTQWTERVLPAGSEVAIVEHAGHFLQLEQPEKVAELILAFIGSPG